MGGNIGFLRQFGRQNVAYGFCRTGRADGEIPAGTLHQFADALDFDTRGGNGGLEIFGGHFVLEEAHAVRYAAQRQAFCDQRLQIRADDKFGRTAANVDNQHFVAFRWQGMHYAGVNQTRFFTTGNDFNGETQRRFGTGQELGNVFGDTESVSGHHAHVFRLESAQAFAKFCQTFQGLFLRGFAQVFLFVQAGGKANHLFERVDDFQLAVVVFTNLQAKTVGTQIDGG